MTHQRARLGFSTCLSTLPLCEALKIGIDMRLFRGALQSFGFKQASNPRLTQSQLSRKAYWDSGIVVNASLKPRVDKCFQDARECWFANSTDFSQHRLPHPDHMCGGCPHPNLFLSTFLWSPVSTHLQGQTTHSLPHHHPLVYWVSTRGSRPLEGSFYGLT